MPANSAYTDAVSRAIVPLKRYDRNTAGPALLAATPIRVKKPDPIVLPKPSKMSYTRPYIGSNFFIFLLVVVKPPDSIF